MLADVNAPASSLIDSLDGNAHFMRHDVSDAAGWRDLVAATQKAFGRVNVLINNVGVYRPSGLAETDDALWDFHYRINQLGVFLGMRSVIDAMRASGGGAIVNVSSNAGISHVPGIFAYATTNWAVRGMSKLAASALSCRENLLRARRAREALGRLSVVLPRRASCESSRAPTTMSFSASTPPARAYRNLPPPFGSP
jgi:NAD(P)-dependent dehydrogenase (short-subunit alcohol dehydrogenase family)